LLRDDGSPVYHFSLISSRLQSFTTLASELLFSCLSKDNTSEDAMAQVIEFYIPARFHKPVKWIPAAERGKVLEFPAAVRKSA